MAPLKKPLRPSVRFPDGASIFLDTIKGVQAAGTAVKVAIQGQFPDYTFTASSAGMATRIAEQVLALCQSPQNSSMVIQDNTVSAATATPGLGTDGNNVVNITGTGLGSAASLLLSGSTTTYPFVSVSDTALTTDAVVNPPGGVYDVTILDASNNVIAFLAGALTITGPNSVTPNSMTQAAANAGFTLDIFGAGFTNGGGERVSIIAYGVLDATTYTFISATHVQGTWPAGLGLTPAPYAVAFFNAVGPSRLDDAITITP